MQRPYGWAPGLVPASMVGISPDAMVAGSNVTAEQLTPASWSMAPYDDGVVVVDDEGICRAVKADGTACRARRNGSSELCVGHLAAAKKARG